MTDITKMSDEDLAKQLRNTVFAPYEKTIPWISLAHYFKEDWLRAARYVRTLIPTAPKPAERVPVAIASDDHGEVVICSDGSIWRLSLAAKHWSRRPDIPQPTPTKYALPPANTRLTPGQQEAQDQAERDLSDAVAADERALHDHDPVREAAPELLAAAKDAFAGWRYIRRQHGDLHGVGWERVDIALGAAIAKAEGRKP